MDIKNIALVRATNIIPFDGVVRPISEVSYIKKETGTEFSFAMRDLLKRQGKLKEVDWTKLDEISEINKENNKILKEYMPYNSDYNSMVLWSLNGLVPDDMNNTFSNKTCAIIDGLDEQIEASEMISLVPTDTAIKGNVKLSNQATILIGKERYEELSDVEKQKLSNLDLKVIVFDGELKDAVDKNLEENDRYTAETLSLRREDQGYVKSDTSDQLIETINDVANEKEIAQVLHFNVITGQNDDLDKLDSVKDEFKNGCIVSDFYKETFFKYLFSKLDIDNQVKINASYFPESSAYMSALCEEIERIGLDEYKKVLDTYNQGIEQFKKDGKLPAPQQIVDSHREKKPLDLISLMEEREGKTKESNNISMEGLVRNALTEQSIGIEDLRRVDQIEQEEQSQENTKEGERLDD